MHNHNTTNSNSYNQSHSSNHSTLLQQNKRLREIMIKCEEEIMDLRRVGEEHQEEIDNLLKFNQRLLSIIENEMPNKTISRNSSGGNLQPIDQVGNQKEQQNAGGNNNVSTGIANGGNQNYKYNAVANNSNYNKNSNNNYNNSNLLVIPHHHNNGHHSHSSQNSHNLISGKIQRVQTQQVQHLNQQQNNYTHHQQQHFDHLYSHYGNNIGSVSERQQQHRQGQMLANNTSRSQNQRYSNEGGYNYNSTNKNHNNSYNNYYDNYHKSGQRSKRNQRQQQGGLRDYQEENGQEQEGEVIYREEKESLIDIPRLFKLEKGLNEHYHKELYSSQQAEQQQQQENTKQPSQSKDHNNDKFNYNIIQANNNINQNNANTSITNYNTKSNVNNINSGNITNFKNNPTTGINSQSMRKLSIPSQTSQLMCKVSQIQTQRLITTTDQLVQQLKEINALIAEYKEDFNYQQYLNLCEIIRQDLENDLKEVIVANKETLSKLKEKEYQSKRLNRQVGEFSGVGCVADIMRGLNISKQTQRMVLNRVGKSHYAQGQQDGQRYSNGEGMVSNNMFRSSDAYYSTNTMSNVSIMARNNNNNR